MDLQGDSGPGPTLKEGNVRTTVLCLPELLLIVFKDLSRGELLPIITVCKDWSSVGIDVLWSFHRMPFTAVMRKLGTLPAYNSIELDPSIELMKPQEWELFLQSYPHKVTRLRFDAALDIASTVLLQRLLSAHEKPLFPHLQSIVIPLKPDQLSLTPAALALGPAVTNVQIYGEPCLAEEEMNVVVQTVVSTIPKVQNLALGAKVGHATSDCSIFSHLRVTNIQGCSVALYKSFSRCPMLQKIRVELAHIQLWEDPIVDSITFTALQELSIESSQPGPLE
ncbi:hypothetical protein FRB96_009230 [Tulasnella sp. 330]|nr:hypothetical protein FRB96_009230 [Tulasnella sp. 330]